MTLRTRLLIWNGLFFLLALLAFGVGLVSVSVRSAEQTLDNMLFRRAEEMARGGPGRRGPPPNDMQGPRPDRPRQDGRGPRFFDLEGNALGPSENLPPWSAVLLAQSRSGRIVFGTITDHNGVRLRVISRLIERPDGSRQILQIAQETDALRIAREGQIWTLIWAIPIVLLASVALSFVLARFVLKPVGRLTEAAEAIAADPKVKVPIESGTQDELGRLGQAVQSMTSQLQNSNERLEESLDQQLRFTSDAAHELRTPLTAISLAAENGVHPEATETEQKKALETIRRNASAMGKLTDVLLSLARMDRGRALELAPTDLGPVLADAIQETGLVDDPRLHLSLDGTSLNVNADAMRHVFRNLLENAAAYSPSGAISVQQTGSVVKVSDQGEGIAPEHLPHLFDRFYRADPARTRAKGGHGLGLSIVKTLVEAQWGKVTVESSVGHGTTFTLNFP